jgi:diguanylate cyclase (GGDEF)-like protein/PAS domain S-box-containing protein
VTLRSRTRCVTVAALLGVVFIAWVLLGVVLARGFTRLEERATQEAVQRSALALEAESQALATICRDWAAWDDTYRFVQDLNPSYIASTLNEETLSGLNIPLVLFVDRAGKIVHSARGSAEAPAVSAVQPYVGQRSRLLARCLKGGSAAGLLRLPHSLVMVAVHPILTSRREGPARGMLVMVRPFSHADLDRVARASSSALQYRRLDASDLPADFQVARGELRPGRTLVRPRDENAISGYTLISDVTGAPALVLRANLDRGIHHQGRTTFVGSVLVLLVVVSLLGLAIDTVLNRAVLNRLSRLGKSVRDIAARRDPAARVTVAGNDELSHLGADINGMLAALGEAQESLGESEARLRSILDSVHTGFLIIDAETHVVVEANPAALQLLGAPREAVVGTVCHAHLCPAELGQCPITDLCQELDNSERMLITANGERIPVLKTAALVSLGGKQHILESFVDITERKQAEEAIRYQAQHDGLTDLPNRAHFLERLREGLERARRDGQAVAVLFLDLDRFKTINDTLGHAIGDELLKEVAQRLADTLRGRDRVARLGGDEFAALLTDVESPEGAAVAARRILNALRAPFSIHGHELHTAASIGIGLFPRDGDDAESLLQSADVALYHAKDQGRNTFRYYDSWINVSTRERLSLENDLRRALEREELTVYYQPQVHVPTSRIVGMEALLRWRHPELGMILPGIFIPIAEETGLIEPIGEWVLKQTCRQNKSWQRENLAPVMIAVNLSPVQFHQQNLVAAVRQALGESGLDPRHLQLEITESTAMRNVDFSIRLMGRLKEMGVSLCLDDFGVGYTSLIYLKQFPLDTVKIDRGFLGGPRTDDSDAAIISAIIAIAHSLGLGVIGEGIETPAQLRLLLERDCETMQGYLFGRPVPPEEATLLLREQQAKRVALA